MVHPGSSKFGFATVEAILQAEDPEK